MEKKNNKKLPFIIAGVVLIILTSVCSLLYSNNRTQNVDTIDNTVELPEDDKSEKELEDENTGLFGLVYSGETITYNAYDFIIEKMSQAQYWTYDVYTPYYAFTHYNEEEGRLEEGYTYAQQMRAEKAETIINATGWVLVDEDTATFGRGFNSRLLINFSENKAQIDKTYCMNQMNNKDIDLSAEPLWPDHSIYIDFNKNEIINPSSGIYELDFTPHPIEYDKNNIQAQANREIKKTFEFYDEIFSELDIPLLNQPNGTLASYKNKTINVPIELLNIKFTERQNDGLIHYVWSDQSDIFELDYTKCEGLKWLDNPDDIFNQEFPNIENGDELVEVTLRDGSVHTLAYYSPIMMIVTKHTSLEDRFVTNGEEEAYYAYYVRPLYKEIFGMDGVYYIDANKFTGDKQLDGLNMDVENFAHKYSAPSISSETYTIHNKGEIIIGEDFINMVIVTKYMNKLCEHYGVKSMFGEDYYDNFRLLYDESSQKMLGLI